jgi:hypothetical protein
MDAMMSRRSRDDPSLTAVETALALLGATETLNETNITQSLSIHMGLNAGLALVGSTRFKGGRDTRWTFTTSGQVTNMLRPLTIRQGGAVSHQPCSSLAK